MATDPGTARTFRPIEDRPPPRETVGVVGWLRGNLFSGPISSLTTLVMLWVLVSLLVPLVEWAFVNATFFGDDPETCSPDGACWIFVGQRFDFFIYGFYPDELHWRPNVCYVLLAAILVPQFFDRFRYKLYLAVFGVTAFPVIVYLLMGGGVFGLESVATDQWGGLTLTLIIATVGIVAALPLGIVLALGRRSTMPVIRYASVAFIEVWRGVPLITVLFMASVMLPLFTPEGVTLDKLLRALIGITLWQSAYMAEVIRGGLQAIPRGQYEAASALGLGYWKAMGLIVLPQALKISIPGIVGTFISLFKDTTLVLIIGLFDLLAAVQSTIIDPAWGSVATEGYLFAAFFFWVFCFAMSRYSQKLERKLETGNRK